MFFCALSSFYAFSSFYALSLLCAFSSGFCAFSLNLGFSPKLHPKLLVQQAPNSHLWLILNHSVMLLGLLLCNELLSGNLSGLYLCDKCGLLCSYLLYGMHDQVREFFLCFHCGLFNLPLYSGQFSNNLYLFFLHGSKSLLKDLLLVPQFLHFDICLSLSQNSCHSLDWWQCSLL
jgi:hypothetical protein